MKIYYIFCLLTISLLLNSCGTKGTLYIPEEKYPQAMMQEKIYVTKFSVAA
tara:strand:- start:2998 stop:3150 length:153 start_codon:yes stop_codon:yes gene_type:complete